MDVTVFDSSGRAIGGRAGTVPLTTLDGTITSEFTFDATLGTYTAALIITDAGGLGASYGFPNLPPVPAGRWCGP